MINTLQLKMKEQKGFTLIELLAVIVILGIIAAIAIPSIGNVINKSKDKSTVQEGVQIINAAKMYVTNASDSELGFSSTITTKTLLKADLDKYLDHAKATTYSVIVTKTADKYTYELSGGHPAIPLANPTTDATTASEQQLITKAQQ